MALEGSHAGGAQLLVGEALAPEPALVEAREAGKANAREIVSFAEEADLPARAVERVEKADDAEKLEDGLAPRGERQTVDALGFHRRAERLGDDLAQQRPARAAGGLRPTVELPKADRFGFLFRLPGQRFRRPGWHAQLGRVVAPEARREPAPAVQRLALEGGETGGRGPDDEPRHRVHRPPQRGPHPVRLGRGALLHAPLRAQNGLEPSRLAIGLGGSQGERPVEEAMPPSLEDPPGQRAAGQVRLRLGRLPRRQALPEPAEEPAADLPLPGRDVAQGNQDSPPPMSTSPFWIALTCGFRRAGPTQRATRRRARTKSGASSVAVARAWPPATQERRGAK